MRSPGSSLAMASTVLDEITDASVISGRATEVGTAFLDAVANDNASNHCTATAQFDGTDDGTPGQAASCTP